MNSSSENLPESPYAPPAEPAEPAATPLPNQAATPTAPSRPRIWPVWVVAFASMISYLTATVFAVILGQLVVTGGLATDPNASAEAMQQVQASRIGFTTTLLGSQLGLVLPTLLVAFFSPLGFRRRLGLVRGIWPWWGGLAAAAATPLVALVASLLVGVFITESEHLKQLAESFRELSQNGFLFALVLLIGGAPAVCEELLFRGYIQTRLTRRFPAWVGILVASLLFAAFHLDPVHVIAVFPLGIWMGWLAYRSGSILPAMLAHLVNNVLSVVAIAMLPEEDVDTLALPPLALTLSVLGIGVFGVAGIVAAIWVSPPPAARSSAVDAGRTVPDSEDQNNPAPIPAADPMSGGAGEPSQPEPPLA